MDFIVVGGVAGVLSGAPLSTFDLDVVHGRGPANFDRLLPALAEMQAFNRDASDRRLPPDEVAWHLPSKGWAELRGGRRADSHAHACEAESACGTCLLDVVGGESQRHTAPFLEQKRGGEVQRVKRLHGRGHRQ